MSEILFITAYTGVDQIQATQKQMDLSLNIRWLEQQDYIIFCEHLALCNQKAISNEVWLDIFQSGTMYCGVFVENKMVSRAAVEKYSADTWEVADVRTANAYRYQGYAKQSCLWVLNYILNNRKNATIRTEHDNFKMQSIINKLGFTAL